MKNTLLLILIFLVSCFTNSIKAQSHNWRDYIIQLAEEEQADASVIENMFEELLYLENNPLNLNSLTLNQLEQFQLISLEEATSIFKFLESNRPIMTVYELRNVPSLNHNKVLLILPFFIASHENNGVEIPDIILTPVVLKYGLNEIQLRFDKTLNTRAGYKEYSDSILQRYPNRKYRGEDFYNSIRYSYRYRDKIQFGITAEKDAGEPFLKNDYPKGYDHYGIHFIAKNIGILTTLALGDYRLSFGQGLILNNDFAGSKSWGINNIAKRTQQPKRHFSTAESGYFRGVSAQITFGSFSITPFYSNRKIDTNISKDGHITSLKSDGLHRTLLEIDKKGNSREQIGGTNINFRKNRLQLGLSGIYHEYNKTFSPTLQEYNRYYLRGSSNSNASIDYSYQLPGFIIAGETAIDKAGAVATINSIQYRFFSDTSFKILHRYYPISYNALYGQAFSEGSRVQNENGLFISTTFSPLRKVFVSTYVDLVKFPWMKYRVDEPSKAIDFYLLATYTISRNSFLEARYKYKQKEKNSTSPDDQSRSVLPYVTDKLRLRYSNDMSSGWGLRTTCDFTRYSEKLFEPEYGYMISQNISYRGKKSLTGDLFLSWFDASTHNSRLYSYERNLLSTFYMPSFYGKGVRLACSVKYQITKSITFAFKTGHTNYLNRDTIGTGTELINNNYRTDLFTYLQWRF